MGFLAEELQQVAIIHVEAEIARGRVEIGAVDEQRDALGGQEMHAKSTFPIGFDAATGPIQAAGRGRRLTGFFFVAER